jgi:hypothetical protein
LSHALLRARGAQRECHKANKCDKMAYKTSIIQYFFLFCPLNLRNTLRDKERYLICANHENKFSVKPCGRYTIKMFSSRLALLLLVVKAIDVHNSFLLVWSHGKKNCLNVLLTVLKYRFFFVIKKNRLISPKTFLNLTKISYTFRLNCVSCFRTF